MRGGERASQRCEGQWFGRGEVVDNKGVVERMERELIRFCGKGVRRREVLHAGSLLPL